MWRLLSRVRYSVTEESRLQSILAISVVSTKNASKPHNLISIMMVQQYGSFIHMFTWSTVWTYINVLTTTNVPKNHWV